MQLYRHGIQDEISLPALLARLSAYKNCPASKLKSVKVTWSYCNHDAPCYKLVLMPVWDTRFPISPTELPDLTIGWVALNTPMAFERIRKAGQEVYFRLRHEIPDVSFTRELAHPSWETYDSFSLARKSDAELRKISRQILPCGKVTRNARRASKVLAGRMAGA